MVMAAATTIGAANRCRCAAGLCPCLFRRTGVDQKKTLVVHPVVLVSHALDHSVSDINHIKRHIAFLPPGEPYAQVYPSDSLLHKLRGFARNCCLLLNNPEKNYCQARRQAHPIVIGWEDIAALITAGKSLAIILH
jgi:hypothetical protein